MRFDVVLEANWLLDDDVDTNGELGRVEGMLGSIIYFILTKQLDCIILQTLTWPDRLCPGDCLAAPLLARVTGSSYR